MAIKSIIPYLMFNGTAEKAIHLYESALGAKTEGVSRFSDMPGGGQEVKPEMKNRIMNATLHLGSLQMMVSDGMHDKSMGDESKVQIALEFEDADDMSKKFEALSAGGNVTMPLQDMFWGAKFGMLTDAYGIRWMFSCEHKKS